MKDADDFDAISPYSDEQHMRAGRKLAIAGANLVASASDGGIFGDEFDARRDLPDVALGPWDAPVLDRVAPDIRDFFLGARGKAIARHYSGVSFARALAMNASISNGVAGPEFSPSISAARKAASWAS